MHKFKRFPDSAFLPLRITAVLQSPAVTDPFLPIDSILYYQAMRDKYGQQEITYSGSDHPERVAGVELPLKRINGHGPQWYYSASFAQWGSVAEGQEHWNKRIDLGIASELVEFGKRRGSIPVGSGQYRPYHMPVFYRHATEVWWYIVGEPGEIRRLLAHCWHIGKKGSQGWGAVLDWRIEQVNDDWSVRRDGKLMRAIPSETGVLLIGFRPSYWLSKNQAMCELPTALR
jgi:CRISPR type IV-associated protein Csf3